MSIENEASEGRLIGRYLLASEIASGGMATVHLGRLVGPVDFSRTVAIKRLHANFAKDPDFTAMFLDEARLTASIRHPNVVPTLDIVVETDELFVVMEYVHGESVARLLRALAKKQERMPLPMALSIASQIFHGLHAAHETRDRRGKPLNIVHRDVSPQNVLVGVDGVARVLDFGVAKAASQIHTTREGQLKGKLAYMAPEQIEHGRVDRRTDVYAASVVLWEMLTCKRLFASEEPAATMARIRDNQIEPPSRLVPGLSKELDCVVMRGLAREPDDRFDTAEDMADAFEKLLPMPSAREVGHWVEGLAGAALGERDELVSRLERISVKMRVADASGGTAIPAMVARAEEKLQRSELATNVESSASLPALVPSKAPRSGGTEASIARFRDEAKPRLVTRKVLIAVAVLVCSVVIAVAFARAPPSTSTSTSMTTTTATTTTTPTTTTTTTPTTTATTTATTTTTTTATSMAAKPPASSLNAAPTATATARVKPTPKCDPPFNVDENGLKHFKPECL